MPPVRNSIFKRKAFLDLFKMYATKKDKRKAISTKRNRIVQKKDTINLSPNNRHNEKIY